MKNLLLIIFAAAAFNLLAHEPVISMYKKAVPEEAKPVKISSAKKGCYWLAFSGVTLITTSALNQVKNNIEAPDPTKFTTIEDYHTAFDKYTRHQVAYRTSMNISMATTGLSIIIAAGYFLESKIFENEKTALCLKPSPTSIGLCLNFK